MASTEEATLQERPPEVRSAPSVSVRGPRGRAERRKGGAPRPRLLSSSGGEREGGGLTATHAIQE